MFKVKVCHFVRIIKNQQTEVQHPEPTLLSLQSEVVSLHLFFDTEALIFILAALRETLRWEWGEG